MKKDNTGCASCGRPLNGLVDMTMVLMQVLNSLTQPRPINCTHCELAAGKRKEKKRKE